VHLDLTTKGVALVTSVTRRRRHEIGKVVNAISAEERPVIVQALSRLAAAAGEVPEQDWSMGWDL
jgi:DNA-binding MarR family transcriptional regulator